MCASLSYPSCGPTTTSPIRSRENYTQFQASHTDAQHLEEQVQKPTRLVLLLLSRRSRQHDGRYRRTLVSPTTRPLLTHRPHEHELRPALRRQQSQRPPLATRSQPDRRHHAQPQMLLRRAVRGKNSSAITTSTGTSSGRNEEE